MKDDIEKLDHLIESFTEEFAERLEELTARLDFIEDLLEEQDCCFRNMRNI